MEETGVAPQLHITPKDEQIQALTLSLQELKQQLASAQQHIKANEIGIQNTSTRIQGLQDGIEVIQQDMNAATVKRNQTEERVAAIGIQNISKRVDDVEDNMKVTQENLTLTTLEGRQIKQDLTEQSKENLEAFEKLLSASCEYLKETLVIKQLDLTAADKQNAEKMKEVIQEATTIKEELGEEVVTTQQKLGTLSQNFEKELSAVKEEIQTCHSEIRRVEDNLTQQLTTVQAEFAASIEQLSMSTREGTIASDEKINNIKQDNMMTREDLTNRLTYAEGSITTFKGKMENNQEELGSVKQDLQALQVAAKTHQSTEMMKNEEFKTLKQELQACQDKTTATKSQLLTSENKAKFLIVMILGLTVALIFSQYVHHNEIQSMQTKHEKNTQKYQDEITEIKSQMNTDSLSVMYNLSNDQALQCQRLEKVQNDTKLLVECRLAELQESITEIRKQMNTDSLSVMHIDLNNDQLLQFQRLEKAQNDTKLFVENRLAELQENITTINKTVLADISNVNTSLAYLFYYSPYPQYREELIARAENLSNQSFPIIVKISNISKSVKNNILIYKSDSTDVITLRVKIINSTYMQVTLGISLRVENIFSWCEKLSVTLMNQINNSNHYNLNNRSVSYNSHIDPTKIWNDNCNFHQLSFKDWSTVTPNCQYVKYNSMFFSIDHPDFHHHNENNKNNNFSFYFIILLFLCIILYYCNIIYNIFNIIFLYLFFSLLLVCYYFIILVFF